jgi:glycosyltransferase involved in cell wall biosynthesis
VNVLQVTPSYFPSIGGVERHVQAISEQLVHHGHRVTVLTLAEPGTSAREERLKGVVIRRLSSAGVGPVYRIPLGLRNELKAVNADTNIVHVHNYHSSLLPIVATCQPRYMVVTPHLNDHPHSQFAAFLHYPYAAIGRWALGHAQGIVCVSQVEKDRITRLLRQTADRMTVIPNGVYATPRVHVPKEDGLVLYVGRLEAYKRVDHIIEAVSMLEPGTQLAVIGQGTQRRSLERYAIECGVMSNVHFLGRIPDDELRGWYERAKVVVTMSTAEAFGMTVLEAIGAGCRVICSEIPAFVELAARFPGHIAVIPAGENQLLARALGLALQSPAPRNAPMGEFLWDRVVERLLAFYEHVLAV